MQDAEVLFFFCIYYYKTYMGNYLMPLWLVISGDVDESYCIRNKCSNRWLKNSNKTLKAK